MKVLWSWLLELVRPRRKLDADEGARALTLRRARDRGRDEARRAFSGVVVARGRRQAAASRTRTS